MLLVKKTPILGSELSVNGSTDNVRHVVEKYQKRKITNSNIQGVPGGKDLTSGECSLGQTIPV